MVLEYKSPTTGVICSPTIEMKEYPAMKGTILDGDCITSAGFVATMPCDLIDFPTSDFLEDIASFHMMCDVNFQVKIRSFSLNVT